MEYEMQILRLNIEENVRHYEEKTHVMNLNDLRNLNSSFLLFQIQKKRLTIFLKIGLEGCLTDGLLLLTGADFWVARRDDD